jgi:hypothetical protein
VIPARSRTLVRVMPSVTATVNHLRGSDMARTGPFGGFAAWNVARVRQNMLKNLQFGLIFG